jgi:uncharacterized SAM-binding protein YcdF (DUF218 family)
VKAGPVLLALGGAGALLAAAAWISSASTEPEDWRAADAALVLSGDVDYLRVKRAAQLYAQGRVKAILLTGAGAGGDSATVMRDVALRSRVPAEAVVVETASTTTRENLVFAAPLIAARGWRRIALVTSRSHMPRALGTARKAVPGVEWLPAAVDDAGPPARVRRVRLQEIVKRVWYEVRGWS